MQAKFNPTGTHIHKGFLKVRIDLYPSVGDKTYPIHHVLVPVIPPEGYQGEVGEMGSPVDQNDYNNWIDSLPKVWQLNPALCHFIKIDANTSLMDLTAYVKGIFDGATLLELDDLLSKVDMDRGRLRQTMNTKLGTGSKVGAVSIGDINTRLSSLEIEV